MLRLKVLSLFAFLAFTQASAQQVTISNNLLYDATLTPNLRIGVRLAPHWSMGLTGGYRPWPTNDEATRKYRHLLVSPSLRYWTDSVNVHHFFGVNLLYSHYNVGGITFPFGMYKSVRTERREGDLAALGVFYGYSWPLGRHWNLEALIGAAIGYTWYNRFECGHCGLKIAKARKLFAMPEAAINIVYNIPGRPAKVEPVPEPLLIPQPAPVVAPTTAALPFMPVITPVAPSTGVAGKLQKDNPVLAPASEYRPYDRTQILRRNKDALYVHFPLGKSELRTDFRENGRIMNRIVDITRQIMADTTSSVKVIQIVGLASIEGTIAGNEQLATNRAKALQHYIQGEINVPDSLFDTVGGGEAWAEFRDQLEEAVNGGSTFNGFPVEKLREAIDIIDNESDLQRRENQLRRINGGKTWQYIKEHILKDQRNSGYIRIFYDAVPDKNAEIINEASDLLSTTCGDCHKEALRLLESVRTDERAQNALGVALWLNGKKDESIAVFRQAAANGNKDAVSNLRQLEKQIQNNQINNSINQFIKQ